MAKLGKRMRLALEKVEPMKEYELIEAVSLAKETAQAKFDESVDIAVRLGVDSRKADQNIRGSVLLPKGTGKKFRVLVFAKGEKEAEAREAGAEFVGGEDLMKKIQDFFQKRKPGWTSSSLMDTLTLSVSFARNPIIIPGGVTELMFVKRI